MRVMYVSWDGPAQNYMDSLFFPLFARAQEDGDLTVDVCQFVWGNDAHIDRITNAAAQYGLRYASLPVWRRPLQLATFGMIGIGAVHIARLARKWGTDCYMPRSIIPASMTLLAEKTPGRLPIAFDADGLMADERVDFGGWRPDGLAYRLFRDWEAQGIRRAQSVIVRTQRAKEILLERAGPHMEPDKFVVMPNPKDEAHFKPCTSAETRSVRRELGIEDDAPFLIYVGSVGPQYFPEVMLKLFAEVSRLRPDARFLVLTGQPETMQKHLAQTEISPKAVFIRKVPARAVPRFIAAADLGLALRAATYSQQAVSPIKVGEYLLCGTPVLATSRIGDLDTQLGEPYCGSILTTLSTKALQDKAHWFLNEVRPQREQYRQSCRAAGLKHFSMAEGARSFREALGRVSTKA